MKRKVKIKVTLNIGLVGRREDVLKYDADDVPENEEARGFAQ